jgi:hypothetical protein
VGARRVMAQSELVRCSDELVEFALGDALVGRGAADLTRLQQPAAFDVLRLGRPPDVALGEKRGINARALTSTTSPWKPLRCFTPSERPSWNEMRARCRRLRGRLAKIHLLARATGIPMFPSSMSKDESGLPDSLFQRTRALERLLAHAKRGRFDVLACTSRRVTNRA